ncbi:MAG: hypothetical protein R3A13_09835 [Bdellovibrionota bacterium]
MNQYEKIEVEEISHNFAIKVCNLGNIRLYLHYSFSLILLIPFVKGVDQSFFSFPYLLPILLFISAYIHGYGKFLYLNKHKLPLDSAVIYPFGTYFVSQSEKTILPTSLWGILSCTLLAILFYSVSQTFSEFEFLASGLNDFTLTLLFIAVCNLIPTFPCDAAFILNSLLRRLEIVSNFKYSAILAQVLSGSFFLVSIYSGYILLAIFSVLTFLASVSRYVQSQLEVASTRHKLEDLVSNLDEIESFQHGTTVKAAAEASKQNSQPAYPILHNEEIIGLVYKEQLQHLSQLEDREIYLSEIMERDFPRLDVESTIINAARLLRPFKFNAIVATKNEEPVGLIFEESIAEVMMDK